MSKKQYNIICLICHHSFNATRIDSKTCSSKCRYQLYRLRKNDKDNILEDPNYHYHNNKTYKLISITINDPVNLRIKHGLCAYCGYLSNNVIASIRNDLLKSS